jgi:hypothetical protein
MIVRMFLIKMEKRSICLSVQYRISYEPGKHQKFLVGLHSKTMKNKY